MGVCPNSPPWWAMQTQLNCSLPGSNLPQVWEDSGSEKENLTADLGKRAWRWMRSSLCSAPWALLRARVWSSPIRVPQLGRPHSLAIRDALASVAWFSFCISFFQSSAKAHRWRSRVYCPHLVQPPGVILCALMPLSWWASLGRHGLYLITLLPSLAPRFFLFPAPAIGLS